MFPRQSTINPMMKRCSFFRLVRRGVPPSDVFHRVCPNEFLAPGALPTSNKPIILGTPLGYPWDTRHVRDSLGTNRVLRRTAQGSDSTSTTESELRSLSGFQPGSVGKPSHGSHGVWIMGGAQEILGSDELRQGFSLYPFLKGERFGAARSALTKS